MNFKCSSKIIISASSLLSSLCILPGLIVAFNASGQYQSLCWQIYGNGLKHPSYLYGTMHVTDKRVFNFGKKVDMAFEDSKAYAMELDPEKALSPSTLVKMMMTNGNKISKLIPDSDYVYIDSIIKLNTGMGMALFDGLEPIVVSAMVDEFGMGSSLTDATNMSEEMDLYFYKKAKEQKKKTIGVETVDEQIDALHTLNYEEQAALLIQSIEELKKGTQNANTDLMNYYIAQNLDSLFTMSDEQKMPPKLYKAMLTDRNLRMADRMAGFINIQPTFIAVGALHLPGPEGVISLLRKKGYKVKPYR